MTPLYLTVQYSTLHLDDETLVLKVRADEKLGRAARAERIPLNKVSSVVVCGDITVTTPALSALAERKLNVTFLSSRGTFVARVQGDEHKNAQLRLQQARAHDDPTASLHVAITCVRAKLHNQKTLLLRGNRSRGNPVLAAAIEQLNDAIEQVDALPVEATEPPNPARPQQDSVVGRLTGLEGAAAQAYFRGFRELLADDWRDKFSGRHKRPPTDPVNAMLSLGYTVLGNRVAAAAHMVGLDPYIGFMHSVQHGRASLAQDIIEMFRAPIVDSVVLSLVNNHMVQPHDFEEAFGAWNMSDSGRKVFYQKFEGRMAEEVTHAALDKKITYERCLEVEMRLLARWLMGELRRFRGFTVR